MKRIGLAFLALMIGMACFNLAWSYQEQMDSRCKPAAYGCDDRGGACQVEAGNCPVNEFESYKRTKFYEYGCMAGYPGWTCTATTKEVCHTVFFKDPYCTTGQEACVSPLQGPYCDETPPPP